MTVLDPARLPLDLPIPRREGEPVFAEPWEARAFALVVGLHEAGHFHWPDFQALLAAEIRESEAAGLHEPYYALWLRAAEHLVARLEMPA